MTRRVRHRISISRVDKATYSSWKNMRRRCYQSNCEAYSCYGGRGIVVCERWQKYSNFLSDMKLRPGGMTLERIDPNGNYEPTNCRWASMQEQHRNRRNSQGPYTLDGITKSCKEWESELGLSRGAISHRVKNGWSMEKALTNRRVTP